MNTSFARVFEELKQKGYDRKFRREPTCLYCIELYRWFSPEQFSIDESHYFEDTSNPDGDRILYAVSTNDGIRGILVDTSGVYADNTSREMLQKLAGRKEKVLKMYENKLTSIYNRALANKRSHNRKAALKLETW